jgi:mannose/fructose/N-acetylgalactosamine-specific phosphotransferase system component IIC
MNINVFQALLIGILYYITVANSPWFTGLASVSIRQPLVAGTIVGIILGRPMEGLIIGATINVAFIGFISPGGAVSSEPGIAGIVGTALAIASSSDPGVAVSLAIPFGLLGTLLWNIRMTGNSFWVRKMDKLADKGDLKGILTVQLVHSQIFTFLITGIPVALIVFVGGAATNSILETLTGVPLACLKAIGGLLPAVGIGITLKMLSNRKGILLFFVLGFYLTVYGNLSMMVLAVFGSIIAWIYSECKFSSDEEA